MSYLNLVILSGFLLFYSLFAGRFEKRLVNGPLMFLLVGLLLGPAVFNVLKIQMDSAGLRLMAEVTLALVLFTDATKADLKFVELSWKNGVDVFRVFDALNDIRNMERSIAKVKDVGAHLQCAIGYQQALSIPRRHLSKCPRSSMQKGVIRSVSRTWPGGSSCRSPPAGLISGIKDEIDIKVCLHSHSTSGIAPMSYQAAIDAGVDILDTAMSPFSPRDFTCPRPKVLLPRSRAPGGIRE